MNLKTITLLACGLFATKAQAQDSTRVYLAQDTSYVHSIPLDELLVTPKKELEQIQNSSRTLSHGNQIHRLTKESSFTTSIPGINAELQRDLPSMVSYFTENGMPILTKQTSNNALTPRMPFTLLQPQIHEPDALKSSPDAAILYSTNYDVQNLFIDPIRQAASIATNNSQGLSAAIVLEHDSPEVLEPLVQELDAYAQRTQVLAAIRYQRKNTVVEGWTQQSNSNNEFSALFNVNNFKEQDTMSLTHLVAEHTVHDMKFFASITRQRANINRFIEESTKEFSETEELQSNGYLIGIQQDKNTLRIQYHTITRAIDDTNGAINNLQLIVQRSQQLHDDVHIQAILRGDRYNDKTVLSASIQGYIQATNTLSMDVYAAKLHDPIINLAMNSSLRDDRLLSQPINTAYYQAKLNYVHQQTTVSLSAMHKNIQLSWYANQATITGPILRTEMSQTIGVEGTHAFKAKIAVTKRWLELSQQNTTEQMPGPAQLQTSAVLTYAHPKYSIQIDGHVHSNRTQVLDGKLTASLGKLVLLNVGATTHIGPVSIGASVRNLLGKSYANNMFAYETYQEQGQKSTEVAPTPTLMPQLSIEMDW